jgi:hypothetical protein
LPDAQALAKDLPYQFQWWALDLLGVPYIEKKKGADKGVDGRLYFHEGPLGSRTKLAVVSVKGGTLKPDDVRALIGVVNRKHDAADLGILVTLNEPTRPMRRDATSAGHYKSEHSGPEGPFYQKVQILTIAQLLNGIPDTLPPAIRTANITLRRAPKMRGERGEPKSQHILPLVPKGPE